MREKRLDAVVIVAVNDTTCKRWPLALSMTTTMKDSFPLLIQINLL